MKVLVTGGAGFIGSHLVDALLARGDTVFVIDDLSTGNQAHLDAHQGNERLQVAAARVETTPLLADWMQQADHAFHLAATVGVRRVLVQRVRTLQNNIDTTNAMLAAASRFETPLFLTSTSEVYGLTEEVPFKEDQPLRLGAPDAGRWGYAASKVLGEFMALAYAREQHLPVVIGRLFNTTGPRQKPDYGMVLPTFVSQALHGAPITVHGDGLQTRCFAHVEEVVQAMLALMATPAATGRIFNIGNDREVSIGTLAQRVKALTGSASEIVYLPYDQVYPDFDDMRRRVPDLSRLEQTIGFRPVLDLDDIIRSFIDHARAA